VAFKMGVVIIVTKSNFTTWFFLVIIVPCNMKSYTTLRRCIEYQVKVSSSEMQRGHVDDGKLEAIISARGSKSNNLKIA
jgi:hypothetical protein